MKNHHRPNGPVAERPYPTLRQLLRNRRRGGGKFRAPWYDGYPSRSGTSWANSLRRKA